METRRRRRKPDAEKNLGNKHVNREEGFSFVDREKNEFFFSLLFLLGSCLTHLMKGKETGGE